MRMWMCDPRIMCTRHLLGEHVECHMFLGTLKKNKGIKGYLRNNCFEPKSLKQRHDNLVDEMKRRGWNGHKTPIEEPECDCILCLPISEQYWEVDKEKSLCDLLDRCPECKERHEKFYGHK